MHSFTWTQDSVSDSYIGEVDTTADPGASYAVEKKTTQTVDINGNTTPGAELRLGKPQHARTNLLRLASVLGPFRRFNLAHPLGHASVR